MLGRNDYGKPCIKCKDWVSPYEGLTFLYEKNVICSECQDECFTALSNHFKNVMGIINE